MDSINKRKLYFKNDFFAKKNYIALSLNLKLFKMNIIESVTSVLKNFANFDGRARRSEYWWFFLVNVIVTNGLQFISPTIGMIASLALLIPSIAVGVRRMHDVGKSGWFLLIPIYNLILACTEGEKGTNEYGPDPKGSGLEDEIDSIGKN
jgi:uncharacterized membrane protein YhaH (DUF805 family)